MRQGGRTANAADRPVVKRGDEGLVHAQRRPGRAVEHPGLRQTLVGLELADRGLGVGTRDPVRRVRRCNPGCRGPRSSPSCRCPCDRPCSACRRHGWRVGCPTGWTSPCRSRRCLGDPRRRRCRHPPPRPPDRPPRRPRPRPWWRRWRWPSACRSSARTLLSAAYAADMDRASATAPATCVIFESFMECLRYRLKRERIVFRSLDRSVRVRPLHRNPVERRK